MSSTTGTHESFSWRSTEIDTNDSAAGLAAVLVPFGRILYSLIFLFSGFNHFTQNAIAYAGQQGIPAPNILVPLSGIIAIAGALSILTGYKARLGGLLLILFLVPVTLMMHQFWNTDDPMMQQVQLTNFMKNVSLLGAAILLSFFGAGPSNIENWLKSRKKTKTGPANTATSPNSPPVRS